MHLCTPSMKTVSRAAANLPQTATTAYFQIVGGAIRLWDIFGIVTTALGATVTNLHLDHVNAIGTTALCTNGAITSAALNTIFSIDGTVGNALVINTAGVKVVQATPLILIPGTINLHTDASDTGQTRWSLLYTPVDAGAYVITV